jgi:hypothetical protein
VRDHLPPTASRAIATIASTSCRVADGSSAWPTWSTRDTWIKGRGYFDGFGPELELRSLAYVGLCAIAMLTPNRRFHAAFVIASLAYQVSWIVRQFETL